MERSVRMGTLFTRELLTYPKSNEWSQGTSKISDTKKNAPTVPKALCMWFCLSPFYLNYFQGARNAKNNCRQTSWNEIKENDVAFQIKNYSRHYNEGKDDRRFKEL